MTARRVAQLTRRRAIVALVLMSAALVGAEAMRPVTKLADLAAPLDLETMVPAAFGDWRLERQVQPMIVNPQQQENIDRIYTQTLNRTYVNAAGEHIMLAIAYGEDQRDGLRAHTPDACYPAQGFTIEDQGATRIHTAFGDIPVQRRIARAGARHEPVTYWLTVGNAVISSGLQRKWLELRYGLRRQIPDGLLFRVSTIDTDAPHAFGLQAGFVAALMQALDKPARARLAGPGGEAS